MLALDHRRCSARLCLLVSLGTYATAVWAALRSQCTGAVMAASEALYWTSLLAMLLVAGEISRRRRLRPWQLWREPAEADLRRLCETALRRPLFQASFWLNWTGALILPLAILSTGALPWQARLLGGVETASTFLWRLPALRSAFGRTLGTRNRAALARVAAAATCAALLVWLPLTAGAASAAGRATNGRIAFVEDCKTIGIRCEAPLTRTSIDSVSATGAGLRRLVSRAGTGVGDLSWSPDGRELAFDCCNGLYLVNADGSGLRKLPTTLLQPAWSPDGSEIAGVRRDGLYVTSANGSHLRRLIKGTFGHPTWSPDGAELAFTRFGTAGGGSEIEIADGDGTNARPLVASCGTPCHGGGPAWVDSPAWSPDGTRIAFDRGTIPFLGVGKPAPGLSEIAVVDVDGSGLRTLTATHVPVANESPAWSPDGTEIAFTRVPCYPSLECAPHENELDDVYVMNADGTHQRRLVHDAFAPAWQPTPAPDATG